MARMRQVKPQLRTSHVVASWRIEIRYFWVLLWGYLDDEGRGLDSPKAIAGDCFPHDEQITPSKVSTWIDTIVKSGPLCRYEVDGRRYLHSVNWSEHQRPNRPTPSRLPACPTHEPFHESLNEGLTEPDDDGNPPADGNPPVDNSPSPHRNNAKSRSQTGNNGSSDHQVTASADQKTSARNRHPESSQQANGPPLTESPLSPHEIPTLRGFEGLKGREVEGLKPRGEPLTEPADPDPPGSEPPPRCPEHSNHPNPPPCGPCADARRTWQTWETNRVRADQARQLAESQARQAARAAPTRPVAAPDAVRRHAAAARAAIRNTTAQPADQEQRHAA